MSKLAEYNDLIQQMEEMLEDLKAMLTTKLESQGFELEKTIQLLHLDSEEYVKESIKDLKSGDNAKVAGWWTLVHTESDPLKEHQDVEEARKILIDVLEDISEYIHFQTELKELQDEFNKEKNKYLDHLSSPEYEKERLDKIDKLKNSLEQTTNSAKKKKIEHDLRVTEEEYSLAFMFDEFLNPEKRTEVMKRFMDNFFDGKKSAYTLEKFKKKCSGKQLKINPNIYKSALNLEEKFLEEEFHVYNNFFLFSCIQFIAHADSVRQENEIKTVLQAMLKLVNGKFASEEAKDIFLESMRQYLRNYEEFRDVFTEKNILHPSHPHRIAAEKKREAEFREVIFREIEHRGWASGEELEELKTRSIAEINSFCKKKEEEQKEKEEELARQVEEELNDDDDYEDEDEEDYEGESDEGQGERSADEFALSGKGEESNRSGICGEGGERSCGDAPHVVTEVEEKSRIRVSEETGSETSPANDSERVRGTSTEEKEGSEVQENQEETGGEAPTANDSEGVRGTYTEKQVAERVINDGFQAFTGTVEKKEG